MTQPDRRMVMTASETGKNHTPYYTSLGTVQYYRVLTASKSRILSLSSRRIISSHNDSR